jgi:hypothetical protein
VATEGYQRRTALYHLGLALACMAAVGWAGWSGGISPVAGLLLTAGTNLLIGWEKARLLREGKS